MLYEVITIKLSMGGASIPEDLKTYSVQYFDNRAPLINPTSGEEFAMTNLDPSKKIVTYCYTGQTSAVITAYLRVLGYEAYSLKFGLNKLYNST